MTRSCHFLNFHSFQPPIPQSGSPLQSVSTTSRDFKKSKIIYILSVCQQTTEVWYVHWWYVPYLIAGRWWRSLLLKWSIRWHMGHVITVFTYRGLLASRRIQHRLRPSKLGCGWWGWWRWCGWRQCWKSAGKHDCEDGETGDSEISYCYRLAGGIYSCMHICHEQEIRRDRLAIYLIPPAA